MIHRVFIAALVALAFATGCAFDVDACFTDLDCPVNTVCAQPPGTPSPLCIAPEQLDAGSDDMGEDPDERGEGDMEDPDDSPDADPDEPDQRDTRDTDPQIEEGSCGRAVSCDAFPPDQLGPLNDRVVGCPSRDFVGFRETIEHGMCGRESDYYQIDYARCRNGSFTITVVLEVGYQCTDVAEFFLTDRSCDEPEVDCLVRGNGTTTVSLEVGRTDFATPIESFEFGVDSSVRDGGVWYLLSVDVSR